MNKDLLTTVAKNAMFVLEFLGIVIAVFLIAYICEKFSDFDGFGPVFVQKSGYYSASSIAHCLSSSSISLAFSALFSALLF